MVDHIQMDIFFFNMSPNNSGYKNNLLQFFKSLCGSHKEKSSKSCLPKFEDGAV